MKIKECRVEVKAAVEDGDVGTFEAIVSVFGNEDSVGDVVIAGAFDETLAEWAASGDPIPVIWSHDWSDPFSHIGAVAEAKPVEKGLWVKGNLDLDNEKAAQVFRLLKARRVKQFSFAYDVLEGAWVETPGEGGRYGGGYYELRKLKLYEVGPCLIGANQETELLAAKAAGVLAGLKEGRVLATAHLDRLKEAHAALGDVITAADKAPITDDEKSSPKPPAPSGAGSEEQTGQPSKTGDRTAVTRPRLSPAVVSASATALLIEQE